MPDIDELSIKIDASAKSSMAELDKLIGKLTVLSSAFTKVGNSSLKSFTVNLNAATRSVAVLNKSLRMTDIKKVENSLRALSKINLNNLSGLQTLTNIGSNPNMSQSAANMQQFGVAVNDMITKIASAPTIDPHNVQALRALATISLGNFGGSGGGSGGGKFSFGSMFKGWYEGASSLLRIGKNLTSVIGKGMANAFSAAGSAAASAGKRLLTFVTHTRSLRTSVTDLTRSLRNLYMRIFLLRRIVKAIGSAFSGSMNMIESYHYFDVSVKKIGQESKDAFAQFGYDSAEEYADSFRTRLLALNEQMSGYTFDSNGYGVSNGMKSLGMDADTVMQYQAQYAQMANSIGMAGEAAFNTSTALTMLAADWSSLRNISFESSFEKMASALAGQTRAVRSLGIDITQAALQQELANIGIDATVSKLTQAQKAELRMIAILRQSRIAWGDMATTLNTPANQMRLLQQNAKALARTLGNLFLPVIRTVLPFVNGLVLALRRLFEWLVKFAGIDVASASSSVGGLSDAFADMEDSDVFDNIADSATTAAGNLEEQAEELKRTILGFDEINKLDDPDSGSSKSSSGDSGAGGGLGIDDSLLDAALGDILGEYQKVWNDAFEKMQSTAQNFADNMARIGQNIWGFIQNKDWEGLGDYFSTGINSVLDKIYSVVSWNNVGPKVMPFIDAITGTINSMVDSTGVNFTRIGQVAGAGINTFVNTVNGMNNGIHWHDIGVRISEGLDGLIGEVNWPNLGMLLSSKFRNVISVIDGIVSNTVVFQNAGDAMATMLNSAIMTADFPAAGTTLRKALNSIWAFGKRAIYKFDFIGTAKQIAGFFNNALDPDASWWDDAADTLNKAINGILDGLLSFMDTTEETFTGIAEKIKENFSNAVHDEVTWDKAGTTLSEFIKGIIGFLNDAMPKEEDWYALGERVGEFLEKIPWEDCFETAADILWKAFSNFVKGLWDSGATGKIVALLASVKAIGWVTVFVRKIGAILIGESNVALLAGSCKSLLMSAFRQGALAISSTQLGAAIAGLAGVAAVAVSGIVLGELPHVFEKLQSYTEQLQGLNGIISSAGGLWDDTLRQMQNVGILSKDKVDAIKLVIDECETAGKSFEETTAAVVGKLEEYGVSYDEASRYLSDRAKDTASEMGLAWANASEEIKKLGDGYSELATVFNLKGTSMETDVDGFAAIMRGVFNEMGGLSEGARTAFEDIVLSATNSQSALESTLTRLRDDFGWTEDDINEFISKLGIEFPEGLKNLETSTATSMTGVSSSVQEAKNEMLSLRDNMKTAASEASTSVSSEWSSVAADMSERFEEVKNLSDEEWGMVKTFLANHQSDMVADSNENMRSVFNNVKRWNETIKNHVDRKWAEIGEAIGTGFTNGNSGFQSILDGVTGTIANWGVTISGNLYNIGKIAAMSLSNGFQSQHIVLPHIQNHWQRYTYGNGGWFDVPNLSISWYAKGGLFTNPTLAGFGEAGDEAALPLTNKGVMARVAGAIADAGGVGSLSRDEIIDAVATGVAMAMGQNPQSVEVVVHSELKTNDEKLAQAVTRGRAKLDSRYNRVAGYSY